MHYVMSDIHGCYGEYQLLLKKINFSEEDVLILLGDYVDRGPAPIPVLFDMMSRPNVYPLMGNHDYVAYYIMSKIGIDYDPGESITKFLEGIRVCDADSEPDLIRCMEKLRAFHQMHLSVPHTFDIFGQIEFYETLWKGQSSMYKDYSATKAKVLSLKPFIDGLDKDWCLTHIDAVPDNFLFYTPAEGSEEELQLTDWEYSGMQDPHVDIAMFCIYSLYNKKQVDRLIDIYFQNKCVRVDFFSAHFQRH